MKSNPTLYPSLKPTSADGLTNKDFQTSQDVRWCPGCGDYSILAQVQRTLPSLGIPRERYVFVSGIGCSSRFPYYMDTFGMHSIHGRAPAIATGVKALRPDLSVWVVTGDGDALSIGGNHLIHTLRRNVDLKILLFNNQIYGLTKGQYSPTSEQGKRTKSTPLGSLDHPFTPLSVALGAEATFVARTLDVEAKHLQAMIVRMAAHKGTALLEIYQNCNIFNDGAFAHLTERKTKADTQLLLEHGKPLRFGPDGSRGVVLECDGTPRVVEVAEVGESALAVHDESNLVLAQALARLHLTPGAPTALGVLRAVNRPTYDAQLEAQVEQAVVNRPGLTVQSLLDSGGTWEVE